MKDKIYLVISNFIEEKIKKIFEFPEEIGFIDIFGLFSGLREQEIITLKNKRFLIIVKGHCNSIHKVDSRSRINNLKLNVISCN